MHKTLVQTLLAAFCAILSAAPLEGGGVMLIGARNAMLAGGWKNPYITDGLVAMWDGEWNAGPGVHDANATVWKDLTGNGYDGTIGSRVVVGADCMTFDGTRSASNAVSIGSSWFGKPSQMTIEAVYVRDGNGEHSVECVCGGWEGTSRSGMVLYAKTSRSVCAAEVLVETKTDRLVWATFAADLLPISLVATVDASYFSLYRDGSLDSRSRGGIIDWSNNATPFYIGCDYFSPTEYHIKGRVFGVRIYSRALTADEIAANYAVDKARFNLPDAT